MNSSQVLIVDDDPELLMMVVDILSQDGYHTHTVTSGEQALAALRQQPFDLVLADIRMPRMSGIDLLAQIRSMSLDADVILITAYASLRTAIQALRLGAVDYVEKPLKPALLRERVRQALEARRSREPGTQALRRGGLTLDLAARQVWLDGREVPLTCREYDVLVFLVQRNGRPVGFEELLRRVWGIATVDEPGVDAVKACVCRLRKKLGDAAREPRYIANVRGFGYQFVG